MIAMLALLACGTDAPSSTPPSPPALSAAPATRDPRAPVPLLPSMAWHQKQRMMAHLEGIQAIQEALAAGDFEAVEVAVAPMRSSPQTRARCEHMGAGAEGFTALALAFHASADRISAAAEARDSGAVLAATAATLAVCTRCHAAYRQEIVDAATYEARTGAAHRALSGD